MSRPESEYVTALRAFREKLVEARRHVVLDDNLDATMQKFAEIETTIGLVDKAIENELDLTPIPHVDDPTEPAPPL